MGATPHRTRDKTRRLITINELAAYFGVSRYIMRGCINEYEKLDLHDVYSIMDFFLWVLGRDGPKAQQAG